MWYRERRRARTRSQQLTFQVTKEPPSAARGLILLVSPFDPRDATFKQEQVLLPKIAAIVDKSLHDLTEADFGTINLQGSNLRPLIDAVAFHAGENTLRDVWLITTQSDPTATGNTAAAKGSEQAGQILAKYLGYRYGERVQVHKDGLCVKAWDYGDLWKKAEHIFRTSGYKDEVLLADVTGGPR